MHEKITESTGITYGKKGFDFGGRRDARIIYRRRDGCPHGKSCDV